MRKFDYIENWKSLLVPEVVEMLSKIHEYKGEQNLFIATKPEVLTYLLEIAKVESTEASNRIECISTTDQRLKQIALDKTQPRNRSEQELAGYRDVLKTIHENFDYIFVKPSYIQQLHQQLYSYSGKDYGGKFKVVDNYISESHADDTHRIRFMPVLAWETPDTIENICVAYNEAVDGKGVDPLLIIPMYILDFLCTHPFSEGNGRMSRLLTLLLLYRAGYLVGKYISIERIIEKSKETYYETLEKSYENWHEENNNYLPFVKYTLGVILAAYREFSDRAKILVTQNVSKPERIKELIKTHIGKITKHEIIKQCPDISEITIQRTLAELVANKTLIKIGGGRYTSYIWNHEKE